MHANTDWLIGKRVLITGAAGGIGSAMARAFAAGGAELLLADRAADGLAKIAADVKGAAFTFDQSDAGSITALAEAVGSIDILLNNAGILEVAPLIDTDPSAIDRILRTNLIGPITLARLLVPGMAERARGADTMSVIVNTASQLAFDAAVGRGIYAIAKAGLVQFTKTAGAEWAPLGVRVCAIGPGRTLTPMNAKLLADPLDRARALAGIPSGRFGSADEMAQLVLFLASPAADYVVGETLVADGGYVLVSGRGA